MKVLFVQQDVFQNYGIMILSAILKQHGHNTDVLVDALEKDVLARYREFNPDLVMFSITTTRFPWMKSLARQFKKIQDVPVLVGGPHPTFYPQIIHHDFVDMVCVGEGEGAVLELVQRMSKGLDYSDVGNLWVKLNGKIHENPITHLIEDLDGVPFADRKLYKKYSLLRDQNMDSFMASRGCPYDCTFCFNKKYNDLYKGKGKIMRRRSVDSMIQELKQVKLTNEKVDYIVFNDDTFVLGPRAWFKEFLIKYKQEIGMKFSVTARANLITDEILTLLSEAGCNSIRMGIESADVGIREKILKKGITNDQIEKAVKKIKQYGIKLQVYNILGTPGETLETALATYEFSYKLHPQFAWCSLMQPYPGTEIAEIAQKENLIDAEHDFDDLESSYFSTIPLKVANKKELVNLQKLFQFGNALRLSPKTMRWLIKIPHNPLFDFIFKANYAIGIKRMDNLAWSYVIRVGLSSREYFKRSRKQESTIKKEISVTPKPAL